jgi:hypothetical protein
MWRFKLGGVCVNILFCLCKYFILCLCKNFVRFCCKNLVCSVFCVLCFVILVKFFLILFLFLGLCVRTYLCTVDRMLGAAFDLALVSSTAAPQPALTLMRAAFDLALVSSTAAHPAQHTLRHTCGRTYPVSSNTKPIAPLAPGTSAVERTYVRSNVLELGLS